MAPDVAAHSAKMTLKNRRLSPTAYTARTIGPPRRRVLLGAYVAMLVVSALFAVPRVSAAVKPSWAGGDFWTYDVSGTSLTRPGNGTLRIEVVGTESISVGSKSYLCYNLTEAESLSHSQPFVVYENLSGNAWYRVADLSIVQEDLSGTYVTPSLDLSWPLSVRYFWDPPNDILWPLNAGAVWSTMSSMNLTVTLNGARGWRNTTLLTNYLVEPERAISVPGGTFLSTPVNGTDSTGDRNVTYWSDEVGHVVLHQAFDASNGETQTVRLSSYRYQGASPKPSPFGVIVLMAGVGIGIFVASVAVGLKVMNSRRERKRGGYVSGRPSHVLQPPTSPVEGMKGGSDPEPARVEGERRS